jgi:hypothetical protein
MDLDKLNSYMVDRAYVTAAFMVVVGIMAIVTGEPAGVWGIAGGICVAILGRRLAKATGGEAE